LLRENLPQQHLLGEVLRRNHDPCRLPATRRQQQAQAADNRRSIHSNPSSAANANAAAGSAPASTVVLSNIAIPRKMNTPSPPPPIAAAIVAVPIVVTVAIRSPTTIDGIANGSSTCHRICRPVIPIAIADSMAARSTPRIPVSVL